VSARYRIKKNGLAVVERVKIELAARVTVG
jgi:hypothetical protein